MSDIIASMRENDLLFSFLPGFAPILLYILVEALFGETAGLVAGIALGVGEFIFILVKERRLDAFSLADTVLLAVMGALSWALSDPFFFRLKPAISGAVLALLMIAGSLGPRRLFLPYMEKKMGMGTLPPFVAERLLRMIAGFGLLTLVHSALTAVAALWWSKAVWSFVAGALFWILAFLYLAAWTVPSLVVRRRARQQARTAGAFSVGANGKPVEGFGEILPIVDETGRVIGKAPRPLCHSGGTGSSAKLLHPVVRLWLSDGKGGFWMQKRSLSKLVQPGKWDCAVGGHISFGETAEAALRREAREEIGLADPGSVRQLGAFVWETELERELVFVFIAVLPPSVQLRADSLEVDEIRLWSVSDLLEGASLVTELVQRELKTVPALRLVAHNNSL